jgi:hypothetical protein
MTQKRNIKPIITLIALVIIGILYFFRTSEQYGMDGDHFVRFSFIQIYWYDIMTTAVLIAYALFCMWTDRFFKKPWKKRNYLPLLLIAGSGVLIVSLWHIDQRIRAVIP